MNKIAIALFLCLLFTTFAKAQTNKGDWMVGGSMTINTTKNNSDFTLDPDAGYFFANNFVAGTELLLSFGKFGDTHSSDVGVGPFARYYINLKKSPKFKPFFHGSFNITNETDKTNGIRVSNTVTGLFIGGGGAIFINSNVALEGVAGYNRSKFEANDAQGGFRFRVGFQVHLLGSEVKTKKNTTM
jgi:outer membrane protein with beta-barrel domain